MLIATFVICTFTIVLLLIFVDLESNSIAIFALVSFSLIAIFSVITFIREYKKFTTEKHIETAEEYYEKKYGNGEE
ncbi:MAG: hypothetical protein H7645_10230 [Candidatus Heimdallarchaeota archaeon]|nr:hypothetical protein [Candidatus Heimdallarchaeota archaeon]MCK4770705.1 hypothetical protein [Candidatus Heimdallarchaeota archaeon]